jgi:tetratricopeptide (TPR) repeat protein
VSRVRVSCAWSGTRGGVRKKLILLSLVVVVATVVVWLARAGHRREWTTDNARALAELKDGLAAQAKIYREEAQAHFAKAVSLDPSFAAAKVFLLVSKGKEDTATVKALLADLQGVDLSSLTPRERFLVRYCVAGFEREPEEARRILKEYLADAPDDAYALDQQGSVALAAQDWTTAQGVYSRLIEVAPNRVEAYNELGYLAMAQERFLDAENMLRTYRYLAPDQANPRDSLGELLALTGRWDEAEKEFLGALEAKPDFCVSYDHLVRMSLLDLDMDRVARTQARAVQAKTCTPAELEELSCLARMARACAAGSWEEIWQAGLGECASSDASGDLLRYRAAVRTGRSSEAGAWRAKVDEEAAKASAGSYHSRWLEGELAHMDGIRLLEDGRPIEAAAKLATADRSLFCRGLNEGMFKLFNQLAWRTALQLAGDRAQAESVAAEIERANPHVMAIWQTLEQPSGAGQPRQR